MIKAPRGLLLGATSVGALLAFTLGLGLTLHFSAQGAAVSLLIINALVAVVLVFAARAQVAARQALTKTPT